MKEKIFSLLINPWTYMVILLIALVAMVWFYINKPVEVVGTTQNIAETPKGVEIAGEKANVKLNEGQSKEVAQYIKEVRVKEIEPQYVIQTTGKTVKQDSEQAKKDNKADFAIVTNKDKPDEKVDLDKFDKNQKIELQQYNVQAYKKVLRTVEYEPIQKQATFSISKKITNDGQYIGVGAGYDFDNKRAIVKVSYTW